MFRWLHTLKLGKDMFLKVVFEQIEESHKYFSYLNCSLRDSKAESRWGQNVAGVIDRDYLSNIY